MRPHSGEKAAEAAELVNAAMKGLLATDVLIRFCEQIPCAFVVIWCMKTIAEPATAAQFGLLTTIEMATAVLIHVPVAYRIEALRNPSSS
jgi:hypothetical protein